MKFRLEVAYAPDGMNPVLSAAETLKRLEAKGCNIRSNAEDFVCLFPVQREKGFFVAKGGRDAGRNARCSDIHDSQQRGQRVLDKFTASRESQLHHRQNGYPVSSEGAEYH